MRQRLDQHHAADFARLDPRFGRHESGIETPHKADLQLDACRFGRRHHLVAFPRVGRHRLFAQDVLAGSGCRHNDLAMKGGGRRHDDRADPWIGQRLGIIGPGGVQLQFPASRPANLRQRFDQSHQTGTRRAAGSEIAGVDHPRSSTADDTNPQHRRPSPCVCRLRCFFGCQLLEDSGLALFYQSPGGKGSDVQNSFFAGKRFP